jgi:hypothetical protein
MTVIATTANIKVRGGQGRNYLKIQVFAAKDIAGSENLCRQGYAAIMR